MMLVIGAFAMLATLSLSINGMIVNNLATSTETEMAMNAHAFAQSMIDEILTKSFDERVTAGKKVYDPANMSATLGSEGGAERINWVDTTFASKVRDDDVDDYHRYTRKVKNSLAWEFTVYDSICYVVETNPDEYSSTQTYFKKIIVTVSNPNMAKKPDGTVIPIVLQDIAVYRRYF